MLRRGEVHAWWTPGVPAALIEVTATRGSVPRERGTRMLVDAEGRSLGTIGGGHLEWQAMARAQALIRSGPDAPALNLDFALGASLGQCCGGAVLLRIECLGEQHLDAWPEPAEMFHLRLFGAGHVGREIARLMARLPVSVTWVDEREEEFPSTLGDADWPAHIRRLSLDSVVDEVLSAPVGAYYLVLTHRHDLDLVLTEAILRRADFGFFGLIGSATKRRRFEQRLSERGLPAEALSRMVCPIGLAGIEDKAPAVIALSVVAQLLLCAHG